LTLLPLAGRNIPRRASPEQPEEIKEVNERYHDLAAASYDSKWGINFESIGQQQVRVKLPPQLFYNLLVSARKQAQ
jgi:hypothetical protein